MIAARKIDSISAIAKRINVSYGWTHKWVSELMKEGVFREQWRGVTLQEKNRIYREIVKFIKKNIDPVNFYYSILPLLVINYCFTKTDAVYIWTEGRYNIARYKRFYPIFIKIKKADYKIFLGYCKKLQLKINARKGVFYVPEIVEELKSKLLKKFFLENKRKIQNRATALYEAFLPAIASKAEKDLAEEGRARLLAKIGRRVLKRNISYN